jgi:serine/threonine protein kinase/tetratricopeptide (TPR) repeat protein
MNDPRDPNNAVNLSTISPDSRRADPTTFDQVSGSGSTIECRAGADLLARDLPAVPGYRVLREIARGGMGRVLGAFDLGLERDVALKVLLPGAKADRFVRESKITARLPHPGIPPVHALGTLADGSPFLAMKLIAGQTFAVEMEAADRPRLLQAFLQVCQAVGFAHSRGVVHRDLKPPNVMVGAFGEVQVMDWGLAKVLSGQESPNDPGRPEAPTVPSVGTDPNQTTDALAPPESTDELTEAGTVLGTPSYMAPEQARGEQTDARADVFALGGILCAILTGGPPFSGKSTAEVIRRAGAADLAEAHARLDGCAADAELVALCRQCLSPSAQDRPANGRAVADGVTAYLDGVQERLRAAELARAAETARAEEATRTADEATERARAERRARRIQVVAASLLLLVFSGGIIGTSFGLYRAERAREKAQWAEGETKKRAEELQKVSDYQAKMLRLDPAEAGIRLMADLRSRHAAALQKSKVPQGELSSRTAALERELHAINATDAAVALLDRTVLAPAVQTIETQFADQPLVDASLRTTLGAVYHSLGRREEALALHERAYVLRKQFLGEEHPATLASRLGIGKALRELQRLAEGEKTIRATLEARRRVLGEDHLDTLETKDALALHLYYQGKFEECDAVSRDVLERRRRVQGPHHVDTLSTLKDRGMYLTEQGKWADAEAVLREVVDAQRRLADPPVADTLNNLGIALNRQKKYAEAEPCLREALEINRRAKGEDHPLTITAINSLAALMMDSGKLAEAEALEREALANCRRVFGNEHANTLKSMNVMGQVLTKQGKPTETEPYYREALETGRRTLGEDHPDTIIWTANLGFLLRQIGRPAEAEPYLRTAVEKNRRVMGEAHPYTISMTQYLSDALCDQGKSAEAEGIVRAALESARRLGGKNHAETLSLIGALVGPLRGQGKLAEAQAYCQQAIDDCPRLFGEDHANTIWAILRMASLRVAQGKYHEALSLLSSIEAKVRDASTSPGGAYRHASLLGLRGQARARLAKETSAFARAETDLLEAHSAFTKLRGGQVAEIREWTQSLVDLYAAWDRSEPGKGYDAKAAAWKAKLPNIATAPPREKKRAARDIIRQR